MSVMSVKRLSHVLFASTFGLLLLLLPATALAAPAITLSPTAVPRGGSTTITGTGFTPNAKLELFIVLAQFGGARVKMADLTAGADGGFTTTVRILGNFQPGPAPLVVTAAGADLAQAILTVTDAPSIAPERLTVAPATGPVGTRFTATGTGLTPGLAVVAFTTESAKGPQGNFRQVATLTVPADGRVTFPIDTTGYTPEAYDVILFGPGGPQIGLPLVVAQFTVTAPNTPGLPNTGGGGAAQGAGGWPLLPVLALVVGLVLAGGLSQRRWSSRRHG